MEFLTVAAVSDRVPMEGGLGWITTEPARVQNTYYYRQMIQANSLKIVDEASTSEAPALVAVIEAAPNPVPFVADSPSRSRSPRGDTARIESAPSAPSASDTTSPEGSAK